MKNPTKNGYNCRGLWNYLLNYHKRNFRKAMSDYRKITGDLRNGQIQRNCQKRAN